LRGELMEFEVNNIEEIVELIMKKMAESNISTAGNSKNGVFDNVDEAIEEAKKAQAILFSSKLELREKIIASIRDTLKNHVTELAEKWCRTSSAISQTVRKLMKWGLINRVGNENNGKIYHLTITEKGKELALIHKKYDNLDIVKTKKKLLKKFTIEELIAFDKICKEYTDILRYKKEKK